MIFSACGPNMVFSIGLGQIFVFWNSMWINLYWEIMLIGTSIADGALRWVEFSGVYLFISFPLAVYVYTRCLLFCYQTYCFSLGYAQLCFKCGFCLFVQATINQLRAELAKGPQEVAVYVQELQKLQSSVKELEQKNQVRILLFPILVSSH